MTSLFNHIKPTSRQGGACRLAVEPIKNGVLMLLSFLRRLARRMFPVDEHTARGEPRPLRSKNGKAGVWIAYALDGKPEAYLVGTGPALLSPVALCCGSGPNGELTRADFRYAIAIAANWSMLDDCADDTLDLRGCNSADPRYELLLDLVFFATDRNGLPVRDGQHFGTMYQPTRCVLTALAVGVIPWHSTRQNRDVPTFEMNIDCGWALAPAALNDHLEKIGPNHSPPIDNLLTLKTAQGKSGISEEHVNPTPASNEGERAETLTAA